MHVELSREELDTLISSLQNWVRAIEDGTPTTPAEPGPEAYLARKARRAPADALIEKLRAAKKNDS